MKAVRNVTIGGAVIINTFSRYLNIIMGIVVGAILARIITPEEHGMIAIVTVFSTLFSTLSDMGLGTAIVQNKELNKRDVDNIFSFSVYIAILLGILFFFLSYLISYFYRKDSLIEVGQWLSLSLIFNSINTVPNGLLNREKKFLEMALRNTIIYVFTAMLAIILAFKGAGIYALVIQSIVSSILMFVWSEILVQLHFRVKFEGESIKKIANYSAYQYTFSILNYLSRNLDSILAGKFLGTVKLAYYDKAYNLMLYPVNNITGVITPVLHPIFSDYQNNKEYIYSQYIKLIKVIALISVYIEIICFYSASEIILIMYGNKWYDAISCFRILSIAIITQMITGTTGAVFQALGETRLLLIAGSINIFITLLATIIGVIIGDSIDFLAMCVAISYLSHFFISYFVMMKYGFKKSYSRFLKELGNEVVIFIVMLVVGVFYPLDIESNILSIIAKVLYFLIVYIVCIFFTKEYKNFKVINKGE